MYTQTLACAYKHMTTHTYFRNSPFHSSLSPVVLQVEYKGRQSTTTVFNITEHGKKKLCKKNLISPEHGYVVVGRPAKHK